MRNVDSRIHSLRFDCCVFLFYSFSAVTFATKSAQNDSITLTGKRRRSAIDGRTTRHQGYGISQSCRAMTECIFGWGKQHGTMRKTKHRGRASVATDFMLNLIAYNLIRIPKLLAA